MFNQSLLDTRTSLTRYKNDNHDALLKFIASDLKERLDDMQRVFKSILLVGNHLGYIAPIFSEKYSEAEIVNKANQGKSYELVISFMELHFANDPINMVKDLHINMQPNGLFIGIFLSGETLAELKSSLLVAESTVNNSLTARIVPFIRIQDIASIMQNVGFSSVIADSNKLSFIYKNVLSLIHDLRALALTNILTSTANKAFSRKVWHKLQEIYHNQFTYDDGVLASFEFITITGVKP
jgi:hypothetical protein